MSSKVRDAMIAALDAMAIALADSGHKWTRSQRLLYERAISLLR